MICARNGIDEGDNEIEEEDGDDEAAAEDTPPGSSSRSICEQ